MSTAMEQFENLLNTDEEAAKAFDGLGEPADIDDVIALAASYGIAISPDDFAEIHIHDGEEHVHDHDHGDEELDDDDLDGVSGGTKLPKPKFGAF